MRATHLVIVAGPPCAGKTTLVSSIRRGALPALGEQIGVIDPLLWTYRDATELAGLPETVVDRLVVHYDFMAQRLPDGYRYLPEMIGDAVSVVLLTLWTGPDTLRLRSRARLVGAVSSLMRNPLYPASRMRRLGKIYKRHRVLRDPARVRRLYDEWFAFASGYPAAPHWVLDSSAAGSGVAEAAEMARRRLLAGAGR